MESIAFIVLSILASIRLLADEADQGIEGWRVMMSGLANGDEGRKSVTDDGQAKRGEPLVAGRAISPRPW